MSEEPSQQQTFDEEGAPPAGRGDAHWRELLALLSVEIAAPLTAAIERVYRLTSSGKIDRQGLRALREEIESAREAGMTGQQIARLASGRLRQSHERQQLMPMVKHALAQRAVQARARGVRFVEVLKPVEVIVDPPLLASMLGTMGDWALSCAKSDVEVRIELTPAPVRARLSCSFAHRAPGRLAVVASAGVPTQTLDSLTWHLLQHAAWAMGLQATRRDDSFETHLALEFPRTVVDEVNGIGTMEIGSGADTAAGAKPLAGSHLLVLSGRREVRARVSAAVRHMGLIVDFVGTVGEAAAFCKDGLPHAIVYEAALRDDGFDELRGQIDGDAPGFAWIEIVEELNVFEISGFSGAGQARIGRDAIATALPSALMFELSKGL